MSVLLAVHITAGSLALLSGYVALYSRKGARVHRKSGLLFAGAMLTMSGCGIALTTLAHNQWTVVNTSAGLLTAYLVITSLTAVRPVAAGGRALHIGGMLLAALLSLADLTMAAQAIALGGKRNGVPAFPFIMFGLVAFLAAIGDFRILRSGALHGPARLARHLWRMTYALFIAAMSFFLGQAKVIPKAIRIPGLLALPVVAVLVTLLYWMWRVRRPKAEQRTAREVRLQEAA